MSDRNTTAHPTEAATDGGFSWFDVTDPTSAGMALLQSRSGLHPPAVEDALHAHQFLKAESYKNFELVVHVVFRSEHSRLCVHELNLFIGQDFVISGQYGHGFATVDIVKRWRSTRRRSALPARRRW
ncbi:CorA family divalent cation transporter (plasmid) [Deinococcus radiomollis]|uniref:CorA family divalent cation transporter n=1 Tax=Deinococcus radiomollis TaxID=468916 RepID=UPI0038922D58